MGHVLASSFSECAGGSADVKPLLAPTVVLLRGALNFTNEHAVADIVKAIYALQNSAFEEHINDLSAALAHRDGRVRRAAAEAIRAVGGHAAAAALAAHADDEDGVVRTQSLLAMKAVGMSHPVSDIFGF
jgi:HEAT repeat protein